MTRLGCEIAATAVVLLASGAVGGARSPQRAGAQGQPSPSQVKTDLENQAAGGSFDFVAAQKSLTDAGLTSDQVTEELKKLAAMSSGAQTDQNASGTADWNLHQLYRGVTYHLKFPLQNSCRIPQMVTITYPTEITLTGPTQVLVPAKSKIEVEATWKVSDLVVPPPPWPLGTNFQCTPVHGVVTMDHAESRGKQKTPLGTYTYICHKAKRVYTVYAHLHIYPNPNPNDGGGGGGPKKPKPKTHPTCNTLWSVNEFQPDPAHRSPEDCHADLLQLTHDMFANDLPTLKAQNPSAWSWLPSPSAIDGMSTSDLLALHQRADAIARGVGR